MRRRWLTLGAAAGLMLALGACGRNQGGGNQATTPIDMRQQPADPRQEAHTVRVASAKVEKGAERATRGIVEGVAAIADGVGRGVKEGAAEGLHNADPKTADAGRQQQRRRHTRYHDSENQSTSGGY